MAKKILFVDDEPDIVMMVEMRIKASGFDVVTGNSGQEAIDLAKEHKPDLIILDVMMPAPNGFQVCRTLKDDPEFKDTPIIFLTAKTTDSDQFWGVEAGANDYMTKPYNIEDLMTKIKGFLN